MSVTVEPWTTPELRDQAVDLLRRLVARDPVTLACIALPGTTSEELERELRSVGDGEYELEVTPPQGGGQRLSLTHRCTMRSRRSSPA